MPWPMSIRQISKGSDGIRVAGTHELETVARPHAATLGFAARHLHDGTGSPACRHPPWAEFADHIEHALLAIKEHDVDREAHEPRVDRGGWAQPEALPGGEIAP